MNVYWLSFSLFLLVASFCSGVYTEHKFNLASEVGMADAQEKRIADGETKAMQFNQDWSKASAKDNPCPINPAERKLLR
jgi:hypothetical protein